MNLRAYVNSDYLVSLAKENNIDIPRTRGYLYMRNEMAYTKQMVEQRKSGIEYFALQSLLDERYFDSMKYSHKYCTDNNEVIWKNIHGELRKQLKYEVKKKLKVVENQFSTFNKYVGKNILYVTARLGSYPNEIERIKKESYYIDHAICGDDRNICRFLL